MKRLYINLMRTIRGESLAHAKARIRKQLHGLYERNAMTTNFYQAAEKL